MLCSSHEEVHLSTFYLTKATSLARFMLHGVKYLISGQNMSGILIDLNGAGGETSPYLCKSSIPNLTRYE